jgi:predicted PurR-regulated permease PerM
MAQSLAGSLVNLFLGVVASVYLLKDKDFFLRLWQQFLSLILKQKTHGLISETMGEINVVVTTFLKGAFIDSLLVALLSSLALSLLHLDYAVVIGVLGGILNIIPYFGPFFGMVPAFLVGLFTSGPAKAFLSVVALFLVQQIDGNFIYPKVVGSATGLHPLFVLLSVSIFGHFFGIIGMILAVPVAGILQILIRKWAYR